MSTSAAAQLGNEFWSQPEAVVSDDPLKLIYGLVSAALREEIEERGGSVLDLMLAERTAALYVSVRQKETKKAFPHERSYKETMQLLVQMMSALKKPWDSQDATKSGEQAFEKLAAKVTDAVHKLPPEMQEAVTQVLEEAGL